MEEALGPEEVARGVDETSFQGSFISIYLSIYRCIDIDIDRYIYIYMYIYNVYIIYIYIYLFIYFLIYLYLYYMGFTIRVQGSFCSRGFQVSVHRICVGFGRTGGLGLYRLRFRFRFRLIA